MNFCLEYFFFLVKRHFVILACVMFFCWWLVRSQPTDSGNTQYPIPSATDTPLALVYGPDVTCLRCLKASMVTSETSVIYRTCSRPLALRCVCVCVCGCVWRYEDFSVGARNST